MCLRPRRFLVTGASGFVGKHLLSALEKYAPESQCFGWTTQTIRDAEYCHWKTVDLEDQRQINQAIREIQPTHVIHLGAMSHVPTSFRSPEKVMHINLLGTMYLLEAIKREVPEAVFLNIGSSEVYGKTFTEERLMTEEDILQPRNPYAVSKASADLLAGQYAEQGLNIIRLRPFNHTGYGQSESFVIPSFAKQISKIEKGEQEPFIWVGNTSSVRDFLDVRDVVDSYIKVIDRFDHLDSGEILNICSSKPRSISMILEAMLAMSDRKIAIKTDPDRMRPSDIPYAVGDGEKARKRLGWKPQYNMEQTLNSVLQQWREDNVS